MYANDGRRRTTSKKLSSILGSKLRIAMNRRDVVEKNVRSKRNTKRHVFPRLRDYFAYVRIVSMQHREGSSKLARLPSMENERKILDQIKNMDSTLFDRGSGLNERLLHVLGTMFEVNVRLSASTIKRQFVTQINAKRWYDSYYNDCRLGLFDRNVPFVIRVCSGKERENSSFSTFTRHFHVKPVRFDVSNTLYAKCSCENDDKRDSVETGDLCDLGVRSLYYQRIYLMQFIVWLLICEGMYNLFDS